MSILSTAPSQVRPTRYSELLRAGRLDGHDATPDDYDRVLAEAAAVSAWAVRHGHDLVDAMARGLMTAILVIDPRRQEPPY
jgi:hypothetical protein